MTDAHALQALREKVEDGVLLMGVLAPEHETKAYDALSGSLDAAKQLHEALLPGWDWRLRDNRAWVWRGVQAYGGDETEDEVGHGLPARAWLLAILDALIREAGE